MAIGDRVTGVLPLAGAAAAAMALAGVAVFTVNQAGCADAGHYVRHPDGQLELVGSCIDPAHLPPAKPRVDPVDRVDEPNKPAEPASNHRNDLNRIEQAP